MECASAAGSGDWSARHAGAVSKLFPATSGLADRTGWPRAAVRSLSVKAWG